MAHKTGRTSNRVWISKANQVDPIPCLLEQQKIREMQEWSIIEPSSSPHRVSGATCEEKWGSPEDMCGLLEACWTEDRRYTGPHGKPQFITMMDLTRGYWQIPVAQWSDLMHKMMNSIYLLLIGIPLVLVYWRHRLRKYWRSTINAIEHIIMKYTILCIRSTCTCITSEQSTLSTLLLRLSWQLMTLQ